MIDQIILLKVNSLVTHQKYELKNWNVKQIRQPADPVIFQENS